MNNKPRINVNTVNSLRTRHLNLLTQIYISNTRTAKAGARTTLMMEPDMVEWTRRRGEVEPLRQGDATVATAPKPRSGEEDLTERGRCAMLVDCITRS
jgi:hypothetical protein